MRFSTLHQVIDRLRTIQAPGPTHPQLGTSTLSINTIHGGTAVNVVPDRCRIDVDIRTVPGTDHHAVAESVQAATGDIGCPPAIAVVLSAASMETDPGLPFVQMALKALYINKGLREVVWAK